MFGIAEIDFETFSAAGFEWCPVKERYVAPRGISAASRGILCTGAWEYAAHPSADVMCLYYSFDGGPCRRWVPGDPPPQPLLSHVMLGGLVEAHNWFFEFAIWENVCVPRLGWVRLSIDQMRCSAAKAAAYGIPRSLEKGLIALKSPLSKDMKGNAIMKKLSVPHTPTKKDPWHRHTPATSPDMFETTYAYCEKDVVTEHWLSSRCPALIPQEQAVWEVDKRISARGVHCDRDLILAAIEIFKQAEVRYNARLYELTCGEVHSASEVSRLLDWAAPRGYPYGTMDKDAVQNALDGDVLPDTVREALEIRQGLGSSSVKKIFQMDLRSRSDSRIRDILVFCGAGQTGRWAGSGTQPQNMPGAGRPTKRCTGCGTIYGGAATVCPSCFGTQSVPQGWDDAAVDAAKRDLQTANLSYVESQWGDACKLISACVRGMFTAAPGHDLICSDYSAIEAVVLACMAGEDWRINVFKTHGMIYEMGAAQITGVPFDEFVRHKQTTGEHHPLRKTVGKVSELASGYGGGIGAWKNFGADAFMSDAEIEEAKTKWRAASPNICKFWYDLEDAAIAAVENPGSAFAVRGVVYQRDENRLVCRLPSGRFMYYHDVQVRATVTPWGAPSKELTYNRVDPDTKRWGRTSTYGGKLCENVVQAVARDILADALPRLEAAGYPVVLHVHDEVVVEVPEGAGDVAEVERIMSTMPEWAKDWPIRAAGGWRGKRYKKD